MIIFKNDLQELLLSIFFLGDIALIPVPDILTCDIQQFYSGA